MADNFQFIGGTAKRPEGESGSLPKDGKMPDVMSEDVNLDINNENIPFNVQPVCLKQAMVLEDNLR